MKRRLITAITMLLASSVPLHGKALNPKCVTAPNYSPVAWSALVQGTVVVELLVAPDGRVNETRVVSGPPVLSKDVAKNLSTWCFVPSGKDEKIIVRVKFQIEPPALEYDRQPLVKFNFGEEINVLVSVNQRKPQP